MKLRQLVPMLVFFLAQICEGAENSKYFVFVGEKISVKEVQPEVDEDEILFDRQFLAKYRILEPFRGTYEGAEIEFTAFDHYGYPAFAISPANYAQLYRNKDVEGYSAFFLENYLERQ